MKACSRCGESKPPEAFGRNAANADGRQHWCKTCRHQYQADNSEKVREQKRAAYRRWRAVTPLKGRRGGRPAQRINFVSLGQRFGRGEVIDPETSFLNSRGHQVRAALLVCDCGKEYTARLADLLADVVKSCGCGPKHGLTHHPLYKIWGGMMMRCYSSEHPAYAGYGARGVRVYERWHDVAAFIADIEASIGPRPEGKTPNGWPLWTLDRIDNDGDYAPGNLRWATAAQQQHNRRGMKLSETIVADCRERYAQGDATARELAAEYGVAIRTMYNALNGDHWVKPKEEAGD